MDLATALRRWPRTRERLGRAWHHLLAPFLPEPFRTVFPFTMLPLARLRRLDELVQHIDALGIDGDVVECGCCNGGSAALLARHACRSPWRRHTWLLDSFAGLPSAGLKDGPLAAGYAGRCRGSVVQAREVLRRVEVPREAVTLVPGWFEDTLPGLPIRRIALLHLDADWYASVRYCLEQLYDRLSPGGFLILDDFGDWQGCRRAWSEFTQARGLDLPVAHGPGQVLYLQIPPSPCPGVASSGS